VENKQNEIKIESRKSDEVKQNRADEIKTKSSIKSDEAKRSTFKHQNAMTKQDVNSNLDDGIEAIGWQTL
jgi:hypothetical protein